MGGFRAGAHANKANQPSNQRVARHRCSNYKHARICTSSVGSLQLLYIFHTHLNVSLLSNEDFLRSNARYQQYYVRSMLYNMDHEAQECQSFDRRGNILISITTNL